MEICPICDARIKYFIGHRCNPARLRRLDSEDRRATDEPDADEPDDSEKMEEWAARMQNLDDSDALDRQYPGRHYRANKLPRDNGPS